MGYLGLPTFLLSHPFLSCPTPILQALADRNGSQFCTHLLLLSLLRNQYSYLPGCRKLGSSLSLLPQSPHLICSFMNHLLNLFLSVSSAFLSICPSFPSTSQSSTLEATRRLPAHPQQESLWGRMPQPQRLCP